MGAVRLETRARVRSHASGRSALTATWRQGWDAQDARALSVLRAEKNDDGLFLDPVWLEAALATLVTETQEVWTLVVTRNDAPEAVVPFVIGPERIYAAPVTSVRVLGDPLSDRFDPILPHDDWTVLVDALNAAPFAWDVAILSETCLKPQHAEQVSLAAHHYGMRAELRATGRTPVIDVSALNRDDRSLSYSKRLRSRIRNSANRIFRDGGAVARIVDVTPENAEALFAEAENLEARAWKGQAGVGLFGTPSERACVLAAVTDPRRSFAGAFYFLDVGERAVAFSFNFIGPRVNLDYQGSFDPEFSRWGAGTFLIDLIAGDCQARGLPTLDASRSTIRISPNHASFPHTERLHHRLFLYRPTLAGRLAGLISLRVRPAAHALQRLRDKRRGT